MLVLRYSQLAKDILHIDKLPVIHISTSLNRLIRQHEKANIMIVKI